MPKYLEEMLAEARKTLPGWAFADIMKHGAPEAEEAPITHNYELAGGSHEHVLKRASGKTAEDGEHLHLFLLPDGDVVLSEPGGAHTHDIGGDGVQKDSSHVHEVLYKGIRYVTTSAGGHTHEAGLATTNYSGQHIHKLELEGGEEVDSLSPEKYHDLIATKSEPTSLNPLLIQGPKNSIAFVSANPSATDVARQESLTGPAGKIFRQQYLEPLGMTREEVVLANIIPDHGHIEAEQLEEGVTYLKKFLEAKDPTLVVALGTPAKIALKEAADFFLPHPRGVYKSPEVGWVARKIKLILHAHRERSKKRELASKAASVNITKVDEDRQVVYGVVIDPYQIDTQGDWVSPAVIEDTAHDWFGEPKINLHHSTDTSSETRAVESWIVEYPTRDDYKAARNNRPHKAFRRRFGADVIHSGAWIVGTKLDDELWAAFKRGEIASYSIEGFGTRRPMSVAEMPQVDFVDQLARGDPGFD